ncbi:MAG TPA: prepilin-type N-terminal cleavage/methylation domain-containing protein [Arenimonas sp.]|uniref:prepilin-type N-terminal cleavage/methylation domain-containing protein n=1 Tax=Arenimonas sp. TaxID=1872635 RepID=UPI002C903781|nr:prepilin-type N-terminal cleavage/methylation domain-containing protein [Arenimonas sp.]HMB57849.1 prepilin-type N-terminal cleavage/methylation domain-containing protein [Arenimonas sp.]
MKSNARGFTLIEVIVAIALLAFGLALAFGTLRGATRATEHADAIARDSERLRAVQGFLRTQIGGVLPIAYQIDPVSGDGRFLEGSADKLEFVAAMPGYMSRGGSYLQTFEFDNGEHGRRLLFTHRLLTPDGPIKAEREPEVLLEDIADGGFEFQALDDSGHPGGWKSEWRVPGRMPPLVRLKLRFNDPRRNFPDLVIALHLGMSYGGTGGGAARLPPVQIPSDPNPL